MYGNRERTLPELQKGDKLIAVWNAGHIVEGVVNRRQGAYGRIKLETSSYSVEADEYRNNYYEPKFESYVGRPKVRFYPESNREAAEQYAELCQLDSQRYQLAQWIAGRNPDKLADLDVIRAILLLQKTALAQSTAPDTKIS